MDDGVSPTNNEIDSKAGTSSEQNLHNLEKATEEALKAPSDMKMNKTPSSDNIYPKFLKETKFEIVNVFETVFTLSLPQGSIPADWKTANVTSVFKKGHRSTHGSYRPMNLPSVIMLESIIRDFERHSLIRNLHLGNRGE